MKMKKYNAPSIAEAMKLIRADLGEDAVILNSKVVVTKKFFGFIKQKSFEVTAGVDRVERKPSLPSFSDIQSFAAPVQAAPVVESTPVPPLENTLLTGELKKEISRFEIHYAIDATYVGTSPISR